MYVNTHSPQSMQSPYRDGNLIQQNERFSYGLIAIENGTNYVRKSNLFYIQPNLYLDFVLHFQLC